MIICTFMPFSIRFFFLRHLYARFSQFFLSLWPPGPKIIGLLLVSLGFLADLNLQSVMPYDSNMKHDSHKPVIFNKADIPENQLGFSLFRLSGFFNISDQFGAQQHNLYARMPG